MPGFACRGCLFQTLAERKGNQVQGSKHDTLKPAPTAPNGIRLPIMEILYANERFMGRVSDCTVPGTQGLVGGIGVEWIRIAPLTREASACNVPFGRRVLCGLVEGCRDVKNMALG